MSRRSGTSHMRSSKPASRQKSGGLEPTKCSCAQRKRRSFLWYTFLACITILDSSLQQWNGCYLQALFFMQRLFSIHLPFMPLKKNPLARKRTWAVCITRHPLCACDLSQPAPVMLTCAWMWLTGPACARDDLQPQAIHRQSPGWDA